MIWDLTFGTGDVVKATGVRNDTLQTWIKRGLVTGGGDGVDMPGKPGMRRRFSFAQVLEIAIASELIKAAAFPDGIARAFEVASKYVYRLLHNPSGELLVINGDDVSMVTRGGFVGHCLAGLLSPAKPTAVVVAVDVGQIYQQAVSALVPEARDERGQNGST